MPNMAAIISRHNKKLLSNRAESAYTTPPCNCKNKTSCPLKGNCRESSIIYKATLKSGNVEKHYYGCCEMKFKTRFYNHDQSFKFRRSATQPKYRKLSGNSKTQDKTPVLNGVSRPALPPTTRELGDAISAYQRNSPFSKRTQTLL